MSEVVDITSEGRDASWGTVSPLAPVRRRRRVKADEKGRANYDPGKSKDVAGYDVENFYLASTNGHDHSESVRMKIPPGINSLMGKVLEEYPVYASRNDLIRDAIVHRVHYLSTHGEIEGIRHDLSVIEAKRSFQESSRRTNELQEMLNEAAAALQLASNPPHDQAAVDAVIGHLDQLADAIDEPWASEVRAMTVRYVRPE